MKTAKQIIKEAKVALAQRNVNNIGMSQSINDNNQLNAFDLIPIEFTGMIEDYLFKENREIFDILKQQNDQDIEGLSYNEIRKDENKLKYYKKVKQNIPKYYSLKPSERQKHFQIEGQLYLKKLGVNKDELNNFKDSVSQKKSKIDLREPTPIKALKFSKKQALALKKNTKKNNANMKQKPQLIQEECRKQMSEQKDENFYSTPKKISRQKKTVRFFQFEYVKDFSQYKTPKKLQSAEEYFQPLKELQPVKKQQ